MYKFIINLKVYEESTNENVFRIIEAVKKLQEEALKKNVEIILASQLIDVDKIINSGIKAYAQHFDDIEFGAKTGFVSSASLKKEGVYGSLLSHSEHILPNEEVEKLVQKGKENGLEICVCARDENNAREVSKFNPDFIAVEPKELIGTNISISTAKPELILKSLEAVGKIPLLIGAGIKTSEDVRKGIEIGAKGILVASGVDLAKDIEAAIKELLNGFPSN